MRVGIRRALGLALIGCSCIASGQDGAANARQESCALVWSVPSRASGFADFDKKASEANDRLATGLLDDALLNGFTLKPVAPTASLPAPPASAVPLSKAALAQFDCLRQVWVSHEFGADASGAKYFEFRVSVVHFLVKNDSAFRVYDFDRRYRFAGLPDVRNGPRGIPMGSSVFGEILASHALDATYDPAPDSEAVHEEYRRRAASKADTSEVHVRHIVTKNSASAEAAIARLNAGQSFAQVARVVSIEAKTKLSGGDLGWVKLDALSDDIKSTVFYLEPKGLSQAPISTAAGWEVIEVMDERRDRMPPFDEVKAAITADMKAARRMQAEAASLKQQRDEGLKAEAP